MPPPFVAASGPDDHAFVRCASGCDSWAPHHVRLDGDSYRLCSSCVLLSNPEAYCSACLLLLFPGAYAASSREAHVDFSPGPTAACSNCGVFIAHLSCIADPCSFICPPCAAALDNMAFSYEYDLAGVGRSARVLLTAALLSHQSALHDAAAAREKAERSVQEAAAARRQARAMLDAAVRAAQAEAYRDAKGQATPSAPAIVHLKKKTPNTSGHKRRTPKSNDANRERDKLLKFNDMHQPALAFATAAAAAASSVPSPMPSSRLNQSQVKQEAMPLPMPSSTLDRGGSADRAAKDDYRALFGTLQ